MDIPLSLGYSVSHMANDVKAEVAPPPDPSGPPSRRALIETAKELLHTRAPSTVPGRELAARAGVNYGLVHHYFGSKEAVFRAALHELRDDFLRRHPEADLPDLVGGEDPYLRAVGRSQIDYPGELGPGEGFPIGEALVSAMTARIRAQRPDEPEDRVSVGAKAHAVALMAFQLGYGLYRATLEADVGVSDKDRAQVRQALTSLYRSMTFRQEVTP